MAGPSSVGPEAERRIPSLRSGASLALGLLPEGRRRFGQLTLLGALSSVLDTVAIGLVVLVIQFAVGEVEAVDGYGALGFVANLAYRLSTMPVWIIGAAVFGILMAQSLLGAAYKGMSENLRLQAYQTFRERVFSNWVRSDLDTDRRRGPGAMINSIQNETWEAADAIYQYCTLGIASAITAVYVLVMAATSLVLTAAAGILALMSVTAVGIVRLRLWDRSQESISRKEHLARHMIAHLSALRTIKAFRAEEATVEKSFELSSRLRRTFEAIVRLQTLLGPIGSLVNAAVLGVVLFVSWQFSYPGAITLAFVIILYRAQPKAQLAFQTVGKLARSHASVLAVAELMEPPGTTGEVEVEFPGIQQEVRLDSVHYTYPGAAAPAVRDLDLVVRKGEMTVVLGTSGAGKSTLVNLLLRFVEPDGGVVTCDGVPISTYSRASWLARIGIAGQDVELIDGTIRENLLVGDPDADEEALWRALEVASVADVVRGLPGGLDAEVGVRGVSLSGGQRQRLCLARAVLVDEDLMILDEATNAVDAATERAIYTRLRRERPGQTLLVVAHRPEIGRMADRVVIMSHGRVARSGRPEEVLGREGFDLGWSSGKEGVEDLPAARFRGSGGGTPDA